MRRHRVRPTGAGVALGVGDHDFTPIVQPQFREWIPLYGNRNPEHQFSATCSVVRAMDYYSVIQAGCVFVYWFGPTPDVCVADLAMAKKVLADRTGLFPKHRMLPDVLCLRHWPMVIT
ncbi:hypothetical protein ACP4OV_028436 [Aristida adscensionis]